MAKKKTNLDGRIVALALTKGEAKAIEAAAAADSRDFSDFVRVRCDTAAKSAQVYHGPNGENLGRPVEKRIRVSVKQARAWNGCARRQKILMVWWMRRAVLQSIGFEQPQPANAMEGC